MKQSMPEPLPQSDKDGPYINDNVIRIQLREPRHRKWELCTRNCSPGRVFPTIQLFDCDGNLLVETNDDNLSIKSSDVETNLGKRHFKSWGASDFASKRQTPIALKKNNTIHGDRIYTRFYRRQTSDERSSIASDFNKDDTSDQLNSPTRDETLKIPQYKRAISSPSSLYSSAFSGLENSEFSSYKSSDNESSVPQPSYSYISGKAGTLLLCDDDHMGYVKRRRRPSRKDSNASKQRSNKENDIPVIPSFNGEYSDDSNVYSPSEISIVMEDANSSQKYRRKLCKSESCKKPFSKRSPYPVRRTKTEIFPASKEHYRSLYNQNLVRTMSFLDTYLKSLPSRNKERPKWLDEITNHVILRDRSKNRRNEHWRRGMVIDDDTVLSTDLEKYIVKDDNDSEVRNEIKRRLRKYQRVLSCSDYWTWKRDSVSNEPQRRYSEGASTPSSSSSESFDEADKVLMRLKRRILQNKKRERKGRHDQTTNSSGEEPIAQHQIVLPPSNTKTGQEGCGAESRNHVVNGMGASASRHSRRGLGGRRAQSSGDLFNGEPRQQDSCSVAGSATGDASTWNSRSLPSHLDGRRRCHCGECGPSDNNCGAPTPRHPRHLHKFNHHYGCKSAADLEPVWKLQDPGCDQGYGSERSPEEEFPPSMPVEEDYQEQEIDLRQMYPFINDENTFTVRVEKDRRGLGLSVAGGAAVPGGGGGSGLIRIRRLYAAQPAWATGRLRPGDLLLAANGISLTGLTTYEALEVLRTTPPIVELVVCRPEPEVLECLTPPGGPPEPPLRQPPPDPLNLHPPRVRQPAPPPPPSEYEEPQPIFDVKFGDDGSVEFDIVMTKVNGSLGFTLRKEDHSALGHYVRALVREPALSDGRIQPGDRIVAVNDVPMSTLSHGEAVSFLRRCGPVARLRLYRDQCGTPPSPSAASPTTESDTTLTRPKPPLRQEAVNMLCDIAARKLTSDDGNGSHSPCLSPRRYKKLTRNSTGYSQNSDTMHPYSVNCPSTTAENSDNELSQTLSYQSTDTADTTYSVVTEGRPVRPTCFNGQLFDNIKPPSRPDFLDLGGPPTPINNRKQRLHFSVAAHGYELNNLDNDVLDAPNIYQDMSQNGGSSYLTGVQNLAVNEMSNEPISMPIELSSAHDNGEIRFSHKNPAYQSAVVHPSSNSHSSYPNTDIRDDINSMKKWKCVTLSPENERKAKLEQIEREEPEKPKIVHYPDEDNRDPNSEPRILTVELNRGWNSRLGFSVQCHPESGQSYISAIYSDSVAAKDGRLRQGDIILQVNDENITSMTTPQVIDLLRILRGSICITVLRQ